MDMLNLFNNTLTITNLFFIVIFFINGLLINIIFFHHDSFCALTIGLLNIAYTIFLLFTQTTLKINLNIINAIDSFMISRALVYTNLARETNNSLKYAICIRISKFYIKLTCNLHYSIKI